MDRLGTQPGAFEASAADPGVAGDESLPGDAVPWPQAPQAAAAQPSYPVPMVQSPLVAAAVRPRVGEILTQARRMALANVDVVLKQQGRAGGRFGEVAIAMGVLDASDLLWALSQQSGLGRPEQRAGTLAGANAELIVVREPNSAAAEFIRNVRSQLLAGVFGAKDAPRRALAVVSADAGDGKTYLAANLALSFAQLGSRTMLIDADLRTPRLQRLFGTDAVAGLAGVLDGSELLRDAVASLPDLPNLHLLAGGPSQRSPLELLEQPATTVLVETLTREYEHVIVDTPAASCGADMRVVAQCCGAAVVVARKGRSRMNDVQELVAQLQQSGLAMAGLVMNCH
ncbi:MAG: polysaccharide biosynthesis tyrosine autokinase [Rubrivivax sp.]